MKKTLRFPDGFLWGAATSAHQVEGGLENDWTVWERGHADLWKESAEKQFGTLLSWEANKKEASHKENYISEKAVQHYAKYKEDITLLKSLGHSAYRFSLDWSRIEPKEGEWNKEALNHYKNVIEECRKNGIEPFVTLWHWPIPLWLTKKGGFLNSDTPQLFVRFTEKVIREIGKDVSFWITLNEPEIYVLNGYITGKWPPGKRNIISAWRTFSNLARAHIGAHAVIKKIYPNSFVGISKHTIYFEAKGFLAIFLKFFAGWVWNHVFLNKIRGHQDFIGLNYYFHNLIKGFRFNQNENKKVSDMGWELYPEGLYHCLNDLKKYNLPLYVTEHGLADRGDASRAWYIEKSLEWVHKAIEEGIPVKGYLHWSLLDNFEWDKGFWPRFGLIEVDRNTLARKPRPSAYAFKKIIESNSLEI